MHVRIHIGNVDYVFPHSVGANFSRMEKVLLFMFDSGNVNNMFFISDTSQYGGKHFLLHFSYDQFHRITGFGDWWGIKT